MIYLLDIFFYLAVFIWVPSNVTRDSQSIAQMGARSIVFTNDMSMLYLIQLFVTYY